MQRFLIYLLASLSSVTAFGQVINSYALADEGNNVLKVSSVFDSDGSGNLVQDNSSVSIFIPVGLTNPTIADLQGGNWSINEISNALLTSVCGTTANGYYLLQISTNGQANLGMVNANVPEDLFTLQFSGNSSDPVVGYDPSGADALSACVKNVGVDNTASIDVDGNAGPAPTIGKSNIPIMPSNVVLPVELLSFTAKSVDNQDALLEWITETEYNTSHFQIERSTDAREWIPIGTVAASQFSNTNQRYTYRDEGVYSTGSKLVHSFYYRLNMYDVDTYSEYSPIREVVFQPPKVTLQLYPNPTNDYVTVDFFELPQNSQVKVFNAQGQLLFDKHIFTVLATRKLIFSTLSWPNGTYQLVWQQDNRMTTRSFQVIR